MSDNNELIKFPKLTDTDIVFSARIPEQHKFEKLAQEHGFKYMNGNKYSKYAMKLFYEGGKFPPKKEGISEEYYKEGYRYFQCWLGSWEPKHEAKEEVCGFILSLITDLDKKDNIITKFKNKTKRR
jgi:hypothetical protein